MAQQGTARAIAATRYGAGQPTPAGATSLLVRARFDQWRLYLVWALLVVSLLSWRNRVFYSGGLDPTVAAKAVLTVIALVLASVHGFRATKLGLGPRSVLIVAVYVLSSMLGGWAGGSAFASGVLGLRVLLVAGVVVCAVKTAGIDAAVRTAVTAMGGVGLILAVSGLPTFASTGRLGGGLLPINPNDLAMLFGPPIVWLLWELLRGRNTSRYLPLLILFLGLSWLTGSRTGVVAVVVAAVVVVLASPRIPRAGFATIIFSIPIVFYVLFGTGIVAGFVGREGTGNVATLNSRTIAWNAVFSAQPDFSHFWFGGGLTTKTVPVTGTFWTTQVVDSSWVSAYIQAGVVGLGLLVLWSITGLVAAFRAPREYRALWAGMIVFALIRSGLQSGLIDSAVLCVVMLLPNLALDMRGESSPRRRAAADTVRPP